MNYVKKSFSRIKLTPKNILLILFVLASYVSLDQISQIFALAAGNVSVIWFPSGLMLAFALRYGPTIWPGAFVGAFLGNTWDYFFTSEPVPAMESMLAGLFNGVGVVLGIVYISLLLRHYIRVQSIFYSVKSLLIFIGLGAVLGSLISAFMGVLGLWLFGFIDNSNIINTFSTWWLGDVVGVLLITPFVLAFAQPIKYKLHHYVISLVFCLLVFAWFTASVFSILTSPPWLMKIFSLLIPIVLISVFYLGQLAICLTLSVVISIAIAGTSLGLGPFYLHNLESSLHSLQSFIGLFLCVIYLMAIVVNQKQRMADKLVKQQLILERLYRRDALTGLWNRYRIEEFIDIELSRIKRNNNIFSTFMIDIDDFKKINDHYGHLEGDRILKELSKLIKTEIRDSDLFGRWGGEEFIIITPSSSDIDAEFLSNKLVHLVYNYDFGLSERLSISVGVTQSRRDDTISAIIHRADVALYKSKAMGKNQVQFEN